MIRAESAGGIALGNKVGTLLTWNTLGAVAGTLVAGFVLMPLIGLRNAFGVLALVLSLTTLMVVWRSGWWMGKILAAGAVLFAGSLFFFGGQDWRCVISSGIFRNRDKEFSPLAMSFRKQHVKLLYYEDSPDATVSVEEDDVPGSTYNRILRVNGKPDASTHADLATQLFLAHLPMLAKPRPKMFLCSGLAREFPPELCCRIRFEKIVIAENCEPVIAPQFCSQLEPLRAEQSAHTALA